MNANPNKPVTLRLRLKPAAEGIVRGGHPWVFADSVAQANRPGRTGELAVIYDRHDKFLAVGLFDADSPIRVRILHAGKPQAIDGAWWQSRLEAAVARREGLFDERTTGYRLIHGESDGWPGLVLDRYADTLVLKIYTAAWLPRLDETLAMLQSRLPQRRIVLRLSRNIQPVAAEQFDRYDGQVLIGEAPPEAVVFLESGLRFEADVLRGQKTGFFLDQRENRRIVESLAAGRRVLNAFSFSGGFSVYAARGAAAGVTDLDISPHALAAAERNFAHNRDIAAVSGCPHETVQADAFEWLGNSRETFGLVVLDPPSMARSAAQREGAVAAYERLSSLGIARLERGGILASASCSAHVTATEFFAAVHRAAAAGRRSFSQLQTTLHPGDHPATFKEAQYLKMIYLRFD
ncbi:MAG: class I SAM-dependent rRNA methyltransferase [Planctomycetaceae bacterium]|nr:class I SAM-dependent rRNA methyltransferase [Planctomycetaceae bacterium]